MRAHHGSGVLPLGQFVEDPQQVDAGEQVPPAELIVVACFLQNEPRRLFQKLDFGETVIAAAFSKRRSPNSRQSTLAARAPHSKESPGRKCCWRHRAVKQPLINGSHANLPRFPKLPVFSRDVGHDVLVEELQDEGDAVGEHQVLSHVLELTDMTGGKT